MNQYIVRVKDKNNIESLKKLGNVIHVSKLSNIVILETTCMLSDVKKEDANVISVRKADKFQLAI